MALALFILFLWLGCVLLYVAFHTPQKGNQLSNPGDVLSDIQSVVASSPGAYS